MIVKADKSKAIVILNENILEKKIDTYYTGEQHKTIKQGLLRHVPKTNPTSTPKMQYTSRQTVTQILSKYKTYSHKTEQMHKNAQRQ